MKTKVENMTSSRGDTIANQFIIRDEKGNTFFQSYSSIIIKETKDGKTFLDVNKWDYSTTTGIYRNIFLGETKKETEKKIAEGKYTLKDLN